MTEGKQDLERASQLARKMFKDIASLSEWLTITEAELVQKSTSESLLADLDIEIAWAKVSKLLYYLDKLLFLCINYRITLGSNWGFELLIFGS